MSILEVKNLTKVFGDFRAVDDVSLSLAEGEILGFLGLNGAGKTTTIQMLLGVLTPTLGEISYFGKRFQDHREEILEKVNFSSTYTNLPWQLNVKEALNYTSYLYSIKNRKEKIQSVVKSFHLEELLKKRISSLSSGQMTRVNLAKAFINSPKVLLLDEPTASLDPDTAKYIREFIQNEREKFQVSIIFTSHNMAEVEDICDRVLFINNGKIIANDTPENLAKSIQTSHLELLIDRGQEKLDEYCKENKLKYQRIGKHTLIDVREDKIPQVLTDLVKNKISYSEISIEKPSLEDYFLQVAKR